MTPLGWACLKGHVELAQMLLRANADPLIKAHSGVLVNKTAMALARLHGSQSATAARRAQEPALAERHVRMRGTRQRRHFDTRVGSGARKKKTPRREKRRERSERERRSVASDRMAAAKT